MKPIHVAICPALVLLSACGAADSVQAETDPPKHEMRLQWAGAVNGSFAVTATAPTAQPVYTQPFVYATAGSSNGRPARMLIGNRPGSTFLNGGTDIVYVILDQSITGPGAFGPGSCAPVAELPDCFRVNVVLGTPPTGGNVSWTIRSLTGQGRLTITHWSADRVVATFDGRYEYLPGTSSGAPGDTLTITNGFVDAMNPAGTHWPP
jgi:hypothetical protein